MGLSCFCVWWTLCGLKMLETDEHIFKSLMKGSMPWAYGQKEGGCCMYILYNRVVHYIGKASITRKSGDPGIPARLHGA